MQKLILIIKTWTDVTCENIGPWEMIEENAEHRKFSVSVSSAQASAKLAHFSNQTDAFQIICDLYFCVFFYDANSNT